MYLDLLTTYISFINISYNDGKEDALCSTLKYLLFDML